MYKKLICLISFVFMLSLAGNASADLVAHWKLDEGSGNTVYDSSTSGNDGTFKGDPQWVAGYYGGALEFDGTDDTIDCGNDDSLNITDEITLSAWINMAQRPDVDNWFTIPWKEDAYSMYLYGADNTVTTLAADFWLDTGRADIWNGPDIDIPPNDWTHIAVTFNGTDFEFYVNGEHDYTQNEPATIEISAINFLFTENGSNFEGLIDDVRIYNRALTQAEILVAMEGSEGYPYALGPKPADGAMLSDTWANISWSPGDFAVSHDVYIGDNFEDVNNGAEGTFLGNQATTELTVGFPGFPIPEGLTPGVTYYWRIDEVNEAEPNNPWKGSVWSFSIPPKTAYFPDPADGAESVDVNVKLSWTPGFGAKLHHAYFGDNFDDVSNAAGALPLGEATYDPGPLELAKTYYWRVDEFDIIETHKGDVWSFTTEGAVAALAPPNGAVDVKQTQILSWSPSVFAASHEVYFGTDKDAVKNADTGSPEYKGTRDLGAESYDPGKLEWDTTYYWRIDEVNNANPDSPWTGILWSFTTANFLVVDDFEDYDADENQIWFTWHDGLGYGTLGTEPYSAGNGTGSAVGDENTPSYTEETIVHGGGQSMPVFYDNNQQGKLKYSEVEMTLSSQRDWTEEGVGVLSLWFYGVASNAAESLYVALNGNAVVTHDNPNAAQIETWTEWTIDLQAFADQGVNLANVNTIALGLGNKKNPVAGGSGTMYFDDIRLYR